MPGTTFQKNVPRGYINNFGTRREIEHPNLKEIRKRLSDRTLSSSEQARCRQAEQELLDAMLTECIRKNHAQKSAELVERKAGDPLWEIAGSNLSFLVAKLCESHSYPAAYLIPANGFNYDESVGTHKVNMPYLGLVLRLADILDFDHDRTPDSLYRTIHFTNDISLEEWEKHRSVEGWDISPKGIRFTMLCTQPNYHKAALEFMDWIEDELVAAKNISGLFPSEFNKYSFDFLPQVDRTRIKAKNNSYIYHDLEFSLSRDEVVKLFMTDELYQSPSLCVRELLQNALDALRYRKALIKRDTNMEWPHGKVEIVHHTSSVKTTILP